MLIGERPLAGKAAIVTGSGRNIGRAIALMFARAGAAVVVNGHRDRAAVDRVVAEIEAAGGRALGVMADVADPDAVAGLAEACRTAFGSADIAVSNVSVRLVQDFLEISVADWRRILESNLSAAFYLARAVLPGMLERGWGRIIHISGDDGFNAHNVTRAHNIVCKAGVHTLTRVLSNRYAPEGITINTVAPGRTDTERDWASLPADYVEQVTRLVPVGRLARPDEIASMCLYLAADTGAFITGQVLHVNGGETTYAS